MGCTPTEVAEDDPPGGRILKDELIPQRKRRASGEYAGCSFAYVVPKRNALVQRVSLRPPEMMGIRLY